MEQDITDTEENMSELELAQEILSNSDATEIPSMPVLPPIVRLQRLPNFNRTTTSQLHLDYNLYAPIYLPFSGPGPGSQ